MDKEATLEKIRDLQDEDELEESLTLLLSLLEQYPEDPQILFEIGGVYDLLGSANDAIPYYRQAIDQGLEGSDLQECYICIGICQRAVGDYPESLETLEEAARLFPDDNSIKAFLSLSHYSNNQYHDAIQILLDILLQTSADDAIRDYSDTLEFYKDHLDEIWDS